MLLEPTSKTKVKRKARRKASRHTATVRAYRFPLVVSEDQSRKLFRAVEICWMLRNRLVVDRIENRLECKDLKRQGVEKPKYLNQSDQYDAVKLYAKKDLALAKIHSQVRQNVAVRVEEGYKRFFDAIKDGKKDVHPPKPIQRKKYRSITFPQYGSAAHIKKGKLYLSKLGEFTVRDYRKIRGHKKTVTVKWAQGKWWCIVTAQIQVKDAIEIVAVGDQREDVGVDPGLTALLNDSHGGIYDTPRVWHDQRRTLRHAQKKLSRQFLAREKAWKDEGSPGKLSAQPRSRRIEKQIKVVAQIHTKIENIRDHHHKKNAAILARKYRSVAVEEHGVQFMIRNKRQAKAASDRAIHKQKQLLKSRLGPRYVGTPNQRPGIGGNSQTCVCGASVPKELKDRIHSCPACGLVAPRDMVSANIVQLIAFGTTSASLDNLRGPGRLSLDCGETEDVRGESRHDESVRALEVSVKRRPIAKKMRGKTTDGEPTVEGKTRMPSSLDVAS